MSTTLLAGPKQAPAGGYDTDVIILSFNRTADTIAAIHSALQQSGVSLHITVLDQGSSPENIEALLQSFPAHPHVTILQADQNYGVAKGRNIASAFGHGRIIVALDNDAEFSTPDHLLRTLRIFDQTTDLAAVGFRIVVYTTGQDDLSSWGYPIALLARSDRIFPTTTFVGAGHAILRTAWESVGGYDPVLFFCWEEYDFSLRAISHGWRIAYHGDLSIRHKVAPEQRVAWSGARWFYFVRNRLYIGRKIGESLPERSARAAAYIVKGLRNGIFLQTLRAIPATMKLGRNIIPLALSSENLDYIYRNDTVHRGTIWSRISREILARLPGSR